MKFVYIKAHGEPACKVWCMVCRWCGVWSAVSAVVVGLRVVWSCVGLRVVGLVCLLVCLCVSLLCRGPVRVLFVSGNEVKTVIDHVTVGPSP